MQYKTKENIESASIGNETGLLNITTGKYYILDENSSDIWNMLNGKSSMEDIVGLLCEKYEVDFEVCYNDVLELIHELESKELVMKV